MIWKYTVNSCIRSMGPKVAVLQMQPDERQFCTSHVQKGACVQTCVWPPHTAAGNDLPRRDTTFVGSVQVCQTPTTCQVTRVLDSSEMEVTATSHNLLTQEGDSNQTAARSSSHAS